MPTWSGGRSPSDPEATAESWAEAIGVTAAYAEDKTVRQLMEGMSAPEPDELHEAAAQAVAKLVTAAIMKDPSKVKGLPDPTVLLHFMVIGCLAGAVYAVSEMQNAKLKINEHTQPEENTSGTEAPAQRPDEG